MTVDALHRVFKTLNDPTRLRILAMLEGEELAVQDLCQVLEIAQSTASRHLGILREAGLIKDRRKATFTFYRFDPPENGPWASAWQLAREALRNDPTAARDGQSLRALLRARTVRSRSWFDEIAPEWDALREVFQDDLQRARAINKLLPRIKVCEIGTGTGVLAAELARAGVEVIAVDHSPRMLEAAESKLRAAGIEAVDLRRGDATALPLTDGEVDAAMAHMVLQHLPSPEDAIAELARVVRPGGRVVVVDFETHDLEWMRRDLGVLWQGFAPEQLMRWMRAAGLEQATVDEQGCSVDHPADGRSAGRNQHDLPRTFIAYAHKPVQSPRGEGGRNGVRGAAEDAACSVTTPAPEEQPVE